MSAFIFLNRETFYGGYETNYENRCETKIYEFVTLSL